MKKIKVLVVAITVALMVMGTAFALWTQSVAINVNGTVGKLDVSIFSADAVAGDAAVNAGAEIADDSKSVALTIDNAYPGVQQSFDVVLQNTGSIPAKFVSFNVSGISGAVAASTLVQVYAADGVSMLGSKWVDSDGLVAIPAQTLDTGDSAHYFVKVTFDQGIGNDAQGSDFGFTLAPNFIQ